MHFLKTRISKTPTRKKKQKRSATQAVQQSNLNIVLASISCQAIIGLVQKRKPGQELVNSPRGSLLRPAAEGEKSRPLEPATAPPQHASENNRRDGDNWFPGEK